MLSALRIYVKNYQHFVGWVEQFNICLSEVPFNDIGMTSAQKVNLVPVLELVTADVGFSKIGTGSVTANLPLATTSNQYQMKTRGQFS